MMMFYICWALWLLAVGGGSGGSGGVHLKPSDQLCCLD